MKTFREYLAEAKVEKEQYSSQISILEKYGDVIVEGYKDNLANVIAMKKTKTRGTALSRDEINNKNSKFNQKKNETQIKKDMFKLLEDNAIYKLFDKYGKTHEFNIEKKYENTYGWITATTILSKDNGRAVIFSVYKPSDTNEYYSDKSAKYTFRRSSSDKTDIEVSSPEELKKHLKKINMAIDLLITEDYDIFDKLF